MSEFKKSEPKLFKDFGLNEQITVEHYLASILCAAKMIDRTICTRNIEEELNCILNSVRKAWDLLPDDDVERCTCMCSECKFCERGNG